MSNFRPLVRAHSRQHLFVFRDAALERPVFDFKPSFLKFEIFDNEQFLSFPRRAFLFFNKTSEFIIFLFTKIGTYCFDEVIICILIISQLNIIYSDEWTWKLSKCISAVPIHLKNTIKLLKGGFDREHNMNRGQLIASLLQSKVRKNSRSNFFLAF